MQLKKKQDTQVLLFHGSEGRKEELHSKNEEHYKTARNKKLGEIT